MHHIVTIIGRPNVGKSTLFNRLTKRKMALVDDTPGVTRDRREGLARLENLEFTIIDTAGLEETGEEAIEHRMFLQTEIAVKEADIVLFVIDGRAGITPVDEYYAKWIRKQHSNILLIINKCETNSAQQSALETYKLGFGTPIPISAEHNQGMADLHEALLPYFRTDEATPTELLAENQTDVIQMTIVGRPNAGKSTFINALLKEDRVVTGPEPGITRDAIAIDWHYKGRDIRLIDTAGMRRKKNIDETLEKLAVGDTIRALRFAHVAIIMMDATIPLEHQDITITDLVVREGRTVVLALNKWDKIEDKPALLKAVRHKIELSLPQIKGVIIQPISALYEKNIHSLIEDAIAAYDIWNRYIPTAKLNQWLKSVESFHPPPLTSHKRPNKLKYITQGNQRPPTFTLFCSQPKSLPKSYRRYIVNKLREDFSLPGTTIRLMVRTSKNPYKKN